MTPDEMEPLTQTAQGLLELEKRRAGPSTVDEQRVFERLVHAKALVHAAAGGASKAMVAKLLLAGAIGAAVGGGAVRASASGELARLKAELEAAQTATAAVQRPVAVVEAPAIEAQTVAVPAAAPEPPAKVKPKAKSPEKTVAPGPVVDSLADEAALIDQSRTALLKSDFDAAAAALGQHAARFPAGRMVEEREVMEIQVLLGRGQETEARAAAARFRREHPSSLMVPTVDALFEHAP